VGWQVRVESGGRRVEGVAHFLISAPQNMSLTTIRYCYCCCCCRLAS